MNALTCVNMTKACLPKLHKAKGASIIDIGASGAQSAASGMGAYAASKAAVHKLTESLADELPGSDITVIAILATIIDTPVNRAEMPSANFDEWLPSVTSSFISRLLAPGA